MVVFGVLFPTIFQMLLVVVYEQQNVAGGSCFCGSCEDV